MVAVHSRPDCATQVCLRDDSCNPVLSLERGRALAEPKLDLKQPEPVANDADARLPSPEERGTDELVIALVGPIGSGVTACAQSILEQLTKDYGYEAAPIKKASELIERHANLVGVEVDKDRPFERTEGLQKAGTALRRKFGPTIVMDLAIGEISAERPKKTVAINGIETASPAESRRFVTIIDSVKNPSEVRRLRAVYKSAFWLIGVFAPEEKRLGRLKDRFKKAEDRTKAMRIDEDEGSSSGQRVAKTMEMADYFIRNNNDSLNELGKSVARFLRVIFGVGVNTPTLDESSMYAATAAASRSACLSRQVGVVIVNKAGEIIGTGTNDVPKYGGGLYSDSLGQDNRCYNWKNGICHNDDRKRRLTNNATDELVPYISAGTKEKVRSSIAGSEVKLLIEFSRAVHAEMEAIVSVARTGGQGIVGSTLYSTTYPCHNCARHVVAAGIERVIYIEPYAKSLAIDLHEDAISADEKDQGRKVLFLQYEGVAPNNYLAVFKSGADRKRDGVRLPSEPLRASPLVQEPLDDFGIREDIATAALSAVLTTTPPK